MQLYSESVILCRDQYCRMQSDILVHLGNSYTLLVMVSVQHVDAIDYSGIGDYSASHRGYR